MALINIIMLHHLQDPTDIEFTWYGLLRIIKEDDAGPGRVRLTPRRWRATARKVNPKKVNVICVEKVNVGECCQELFDFISKCINCTKLLIYNVIDDTDKNSDLSHHLSVSIKNLTRLIEIDICDTNLSRGWREVLSSIASPHIRAFILDRASLGGQGEVLEGLLTRLPHLRFLQLLNSGLADNEILNVMYQLPTSSPHLQGLLVAGHDLTKAGDNLVQVMAGLPKIRGLNMANCELKGTVIRNILHQINTDIEVLLLDRNQPVPDTAPSVIDHINQCQSLQYLTVSSSQFTKTALSQLDSSLSAHGGHLLVDATSKHEKWVYLINQIDTICEECLRD